MKDVTYGKKKREKGPGQSPEEHQPILRIQVEERKERRGGERKGREKRGEKGRREEKRREEKKIHLFMSLDPGSYLCLR